MTDTPKNYLTPAGHRRLQDELYQLVHKERPDIVQVVNWAASNGDRSENGDYLYGKRRMREIDRRIRFLTQRLANACVVDPETREATDQSSSPPRSHWNAATAANRLSALSAKMKSIRQKAKFRGNRRWRAPSSKRATATSSA